jgi:hypothetical protein
MNKIIGMLTIVTTLAISAVSFAGAVGGPKFVKQVVESRSTDYYQIAFRANEVAHVEVNGDDSTDLDCFVYDSNKNLVVQDVDSTDYCVLEWVPRWTGVFTVFIKNHGYQSNMYVAGTN